MRGEPRGHRAFKVAERQNGLQLPHPANMTAQLSALQALSCATPNIRAHRMHNSSGWLKSKRAELLPHEPRGQSYPLLEQANHQITKSTSTQEILLSCSENQLASLSKQNIETFRNSSASTRKTFRERNLMLWFEGGLQDKFIPAF